MINKVSSLFISWQIDHGFLKEEDRELYLYAFVLLAIQLMNFIAGILIGVISGELFMIIWFLACFIPLRKYAGGYHADSPELCSLSSIVLLILLTLTVHLRLYEISLPVQLFFTVIAEWYIWKMVPVAAKEKPLSQKEHIVYRRRAHLIQTIEILLLLITFILGFNKLCFVLSLGHIIMAVLIRVTPTP